MDIKERLDVYFELVTDTRSQAHIVYKLSDILFLLVCGILCGCEDLEELLEVAEEKTHFFEKYTEMERIPCLSTISNILKIINPEELEICLYGIFNNILKQKLKIKDKQICIDGKTVCSTASMKEHEKPMHIVTALLADASVSLGQITVDGKSNEIPAVRELIGLLNIKDSVITLDAMHCQKETVELIISKDGDYVIQLKGNQGTFYKDVYAMFDEKYMDIADKDSNYETYKTIEKGHGRIETRTCYVLKDLEYFTDYLAEWRGLKKIFAVKREIEIATQKTIEISCYISSKNTSAEKLLMYTRKHWQIESFHWLLDVNLGEDDSKVISKNSQTCLNIIRKFCVSIIKKYIENNSVKRKTIIANMRKCLLNEQFLVDILTYYCHNPL